MKIIAHRLTTFCILGLLSVELYAMKLDSLPAPDFYFLSERPRLVETTNTRIAALTGILSKSFKFKVSEFCQQNTLQDQLACHQFLQSNSYLRSLLSVATSFPLKPCAASGNTNNGWILALVYDYVLGQQNVNAGTIEAIKFRLQKALIQCLNVLDNENASLWHGRFQMGAEVLIMALALAEEDTHRPLLLRAWAHFEQSYQALAITEAWPEGYNYWVQSRGFVFFMAVLAANNLSQSEALKAKLTLLADRVGRWHIYMTRPDGMIDPSGDEGSRTDLKEETLKIIDLITRITKSPLFATYGNFIQQRYGINSYYPGYYWMLPYTMPIDVVPYENTGSLEVFNELLAKTEVFGEGYFNQVIVRSGWAKNDTFIQTRGGYHFTHHQHADAGHVTVYSKGNVLSDASYYNDMRSPHRLEFGATTLSKNSLLFFTESDCKPNAFILDCVVSQHHPSSTGSAVTSVEHWVSLIANEPSWSRGALLHVRQHEKGVQWAYCLEPAYGRQGLHPHRYFAYVRSEDALIIVDVMSDLPDRWQPASRFHVNLADGNRVQKAVGHKVFSVARQRTRAADLHTFLPANFSVSVHPNVIVADKSYDVSHSHWFDAPQHILEFRASIEAAKPVEMVYVIDLSEAKGKHISMTVEPGQAKKLTVGDTVILIDKYSDNTQSEGEWLITPSTEH